MKRISPLILVFLAAVFPFLVHAQPRLGGNSGGGGNLRPIEPMTKGSLEYFIDTVIPQVARLHFNYIFANSMFAVDSPIYLFDSGTVLVEFTKEESQKTFAKMFLEKETILDRLSDLKFRFQEEPCVDPVTGELKHAAAFPDTNTLCFDTKALLAETPANSLRSHVVELAFHEISHLIGTTEKEAEIVGLVARQSLASDAIIFEQFLYEWLSYSKNVLEPVIDLKRILREMDSMPDVVLALELLSMSKELNGELAVVDSLMSKSGMNPWTFEQNQRYYLLKAKAGFIIQFACVIPEVREHYKKMNLNCTGMAHGQGAEIPMLSLAEGFLADGVKLWRDIPGTIRNSALGRENVKYELQDMRTLLNELFPAGEDADIIIRQ